MSAGGVLDALSVGLCVLYVYPPSRFFKFSSIKSMVIVRSIDTENKDVLRICQQKHQSILLLGVYKGAVSKAAQRKTEKALHSRAPAIDMQRSLLTSCKTC